jgi:hypothetical protein
MYSKIWTRKNENRPVSGFCTLNFDQLSLGVRLLTEVQLLRKFCFNDPQHFCYICGQYTFEESRKTMSDFVICTYFLYFGMPWIKITSRGLLILYVNCVWNTEDCGTVVKEVPLNLEFQQFGEDPKIIWKIVIFAVAM